LIDKLLNGLDIEEGIQNCPEMSYYSQWLPCKYHVSTMDWLYVRLTV